tara:strand:- start:4470 stop:5801 length:1332 start_codon:yes stop_codon:yes gene_type:complete
MSKKRRQSLDKLIESTFFENALSEDLGSRVFVPGHNTSDPVVGNATLAKLVAPAHDTTMEEELPLVPSSQTSAQLTDKMPPIENPDYKPQTASQFGLAMQSLANEMSSEELEKLYNAIKTSISKKVAESRIMEALPKKKAPKPAPSSYWDDMTDEELYADMTPEEIEAEKKELEAMTSKMGKSEPYVSWADIGTKKDPIRKIRGKYDDDDEFDDITEPIEVAPGGMNFDEMADELGLKGASGAKQATGRITRRLIVIARLLTPQQLEGLHTFATMQFIKGIKPFVEQDDIDELKLNRVAARELDSYKFFFVNAFVLPVYNKIYRTAKKDIHQKLVDSGFPKLSATTVAHILFGETETTPEKLRNKLEKDIAKDDAGLGVDELLDRLKEMYPTLRDIARLDRSDIDTMMRDRWSSFSNARKEKEILSALDETQAFQDELDAKDD